MEQIVEVAQELQAGGVWEDLVEALAGGDIDGAEQPARDGVAGGGDAGLGPEWAIAAATVRAEAELRLVLEQQPRAGAPQLARPGAFPSASMRCRLTS